MDLAVNSPRSGTETQRLPFDGGHLNNETAAQRRHVRYTSPDPPTPRRINDAGASNSLRSSPNGESGFAATNRTSPAISPFVISQVLQEPESSNTHTLPEVNGQNHDRMETDMASEGSQSENQSSEAAAAESAGQLEDGEIMDTSPDSPAAFGEHAPLDAGHAMGTSGVPSTAPIVQPEDIARTSSNDSAADAIDNGAAVAVVVTPGVDASLALYPPPFAPLTFEADPFPAATPAVDNAGHPANGEISVADPVDPQPPAMTDPDAPGWEEAAAPESRGDWGAPQSRGDWGAPESRGDWGGEREEESQDDESTDEEDYPFWANIKEDTSSPDEEELRAIEETMDEVSALDHEHWEKWTFEALDDPEYISGPSGRISWTVQGVNGTPEKPNKERIMRSPSVLIGDHYWNIKYYPRGNDGTEQFSVYIECSTTPYEEKKGTEATNASPAAKSSDKHEPLAPPVETGNPASDETSTATDSLAANLGRQSSDISWGAYQPPPSLPVAEEPAAVTRWEVAAQVSCVIHNPAEPRVRVCQKSSHRYYNDNPDWGWTRFHGPWEEIHKRQRFQRQALLRNDTLVFTAYIRTIKDETGALWWHPPKEKPEWNSVARVGLKRLVCGHFQSSALIAAVSSWLYLTPVVDVIFSRVPDLRRKAGDRIPPLLGAFQQLVRDTLGPISSDVPESSLGNIANILEWYGENIYYSKMDVVATWETLRRIINLEASELTNVADARDFFQDVLTLKQSALRKFEHPFSGNLGFPKSASVEPRSVFETVKLAFDSVSEASSEGQSLPTYLKAMSEYPAVLQIELHRQKYSSDVRRWKKLTHRIQIDETLAIDLPFSERTLGYTLYGMIIHSGDLESNDYYSVVRPGGPGSPWVKYASDRDRKGVIRLTSKQAITNHEGIGESSEGSAAVAYVVLYVRTDSLSKTLAREWEPTQSPPNLEEEASSLPAEARESRSEHREEEKKVSVQIYQSDIFKGYAGRGMLDPWVLQRSPSLKLDFAASATLFELERYLVVQNVNAGKQESFRLWVLETNTQANVRGQPGLTSLSADLSLDDVSRSFGGCHFWLHVMPPDEAEEMRQRYGASPDEPRTVPTSRQSTAVEEPASSDRNRPEEAMHEQDAPSSHSAENSAMAPVANGDDSSPAPPARTANDEDTIMDEAQDLGNMDERVPLVPAVFSLSWVVGTERVPKDVERIYFFLKVFDCQTQRLCGIGGFFAKHDEKIGDVVRRLLSVGPDDPIDIFHEKSLLLKEKHRVKASNTFRPPDSAFFMDGCILIVQRRPSELAITRLEAEGKYTNPIDYFTWLHHQSDPSYLQSRRVQSYYGGSYLSTAQKYGRPHGDGIQITMPGDAYSGKFVAGTMSGHGIMAFANGDTYTGQWKNNEPNGQGKMVYAKTGNVYIGGFRKRKRHGKGTMQFEVADEDMQLCRICYEEEMDALFYECGHVAACEACAKQVETCPVCRKPVKAVVKIWRT